MQERLNEITRAYAAFTRLTLASSTRVRQSKQRLCAALAALLVAGAVACGNTGNGSGNSAGEAPMMGNSGGNAASGGAGGASSTGVGGTTAQGGAIQSGDVISVTFDPSTVSQTFRQGQHIPDLVIKASFSRTPTNITSTSVVDSLDLLSRSATISSEADGSFTATLQIGTGKPEPGIHNGTYTLMLCKSDDCSVVQALSPPSVPYVFTVTPLVSASFKLDGVPQPQFTRGIDVNSGAARYSVDMKSGSQLEIESSLPLTWELTASVDTTIADVETPSPTTWRAVITANNDLAWFPDALDLTAQTTDEQEIDVAVNIMQ